MGPPCAPPQATASVADLRRGHIDFVCVCTAFELECVPALVHAATTRASWRGDFGVF